MEWMDNPRRVGGLIWVTLGGLAQVIAVVFFDVSMGPIIWVLAGAVVAMAVCTVAARGSTLDRWVSFAVSGLMGLELLGAVADRFGVFGRPGEPGVSWGSWDEFTAYTAELMPFLPSSIVTSNAVAATALEIGLGVLLISGKWHRWAGKITAGLFTVYLVAMSLTVGADDAFRYALPLLVGSALLVSARKPLRTQTEGALPRVPALSVER